MKFETNEDQRSKYILLSRRRFQQFALKILGTEIFVIACVQQTCYRPTQWRLVTIAEWTLAIPEVLL